MAQLRTIGSLTRLQVWVLLGSVVLFALLYFGFDTRSPDMKQLDKQRKLVLASADPMVLLQEAKAQLDPASRNNILAIETDLEATRDTTARIEALKRLSSAWFDLGFPELAGHYAEQVARLAPSGESWSIAGTTYLLCLQRQKAEKVRNFCTQRAIESLESAASLEPDTLRHRINLALVFTENPPQDNPMKGIQMLLNLDREHPDNPMVLNQLGRLAIQTGQYDRAIERLEKALERAPRNRTTVCLLAQAYAGAGLADKAKRFESLCNELSRR